MSAPHNEQMTVCIRIDGNTWYPKIVIVRISRRCPVCGGLRGEPVKNRYCEDGEFYWVHCWENACGHLDKYDDVYREAKASGEVLS